MGLFDFLKESKHNKARKEKTAGNHRRDKRAIRNKIASDSRRINRRKK